MLAPDIILMFPPYSFVMSDEFSHKTLCDMMKLSSRLYESNLVNTSRRL